MIPTGKSLLDASQKLRLDLGLEQPEPFLVPELAVPPPPEPLPDPLADYGTDSPPPLLAAPMAAPVAAPVAPAAPQVDFAPSAPPENDAPDITPIDRASQALYSAATRRPLGADFFARKQDDPLKAMKLALLQKQMLGVSGKPEDDPNSEVSRARQTMMLAANPDLTPEVKQAILKSPASALKDYTRFFADQDEAKIRADQKERMMEFERDKHEATKRYRQTTSALSAARLAQSMDKATADAINKLNTANTPIAETLGGLEAVDTMLSKVAPQYEGNIFSPGDVTDVTQLDKTLNQFKWGAGQFLDEKLGKNDEAKQQLLTLMDGVKSAYTVSKGGKALTEMEKAMWDRALRAQAANTPSQMVAGLEILRYLLAKQLQANEAAILNNRAIDPNAFAAYTKTPGAVSSLAKPFTKIQTLLGRKPGEEPVGAGGQISGMLPLIRQVASGMLPPPQQTADPLWPEDPPDQLDQAPPEISADVTDEPPIILDRQSALEMFARDLAAGRKVRNEMTPAAPKAPKPPAPKPPAAPKSPAAPRIGDIIKAKNGKRYRVVDDQGGVEPIDG